MSTQVRIVTEAPTPHNNHFFAALAADPGICLELNYIFSADAVPGRPWKSVSELVPGATTPGVCLGRWFSRRLFGEALRSSRDVFFVIGWNHPLLYLIVTFLGIRRANLFMWFDTPSPANRQASWHPKALLKRFIIQMINRSRGTVFVTGRLAAVQLQSMGIAKAKLSTLPFFVPTTGATMSIAQMAEFRSNHGIGSNDVVILGAGRLISSKGFDVLLNAVAELDQVKRSKLVVILVGSGPDSARLVEQASHLGLSSCVRFVPWVEPAVLAEYFEAADIFVAPARFDPFPTTVISAMHLGKPVVATDRVGSAVEFIADGETGLIVETGRADALAAALGRLVDSTELRSRIGASAKQSMAAWPVERGVQVVTAALGGIADSRA